MKDLISIVIPSMNRPQLLSECINNIYESRHPDYFIEVVLVIDEDEITHNLAKDILKGFAGEDFQYQINYSPVRRGNITSWNIGTQLARGNLFLHFGDDSLLYPGALHIAYQAWVGLGRYGLVGLNDLMHHGDTVITTPLYDRQFCKDWLGGVMVVPHYKAYCADLEFHARAKRSGKCIWLSNAVAEHRHSANGKRPLDEYEKDKPDLYWERDWDIFRAREASGFQNDFEPVI